MTTAEPGLKLVEDLPDGLVESVIQQLRCGLSPAIPNPGYQMRGRGGPTFDLEPFGHVGQDAVGSPEADRGGSALIDHYLAERSCRRDTSVSGLDIGISSVRACGFLSAYSPPGPPSPSVPPKMGRPFR